MRLIDQENENVGVVSLEEALKKAKDAELDLVVVAESANPPVARLLEFRHFLRQQKDQERKAARKSRTEVKQLRFGPNIADHDLSVRIKRARSFLKDGDKVKFTVQFKGRMVRNKDVGQEKLERILTELAEEAEIEKEIWFENRQMMLIIRPK